MASTNITDASEENCRQSPLVLPVKIFLPPLHIKLGLMENYVKGIDKTGRGLEYVWNKSRNVSDNKIGGDTFIGPQIRELMQEKQFDEELNASQRIHSCLREDLQGLLSKSKSSQLSVCCAGPVDFVQNYWRNMSVKIHFC